MQKIKLVNKVIIVFLVVIFCLSCNTEKHYKTLSIFFDDVPVPQAADSTMKIKTARMQQEAAHRRTEETSNDYPAASAHHDYLKKQCKKCHEVAYSNRTNQSQPGLCFQCHTNFSKKFQYQHGPVAAGFCTTCHFPHRSEYKHLLVMPLRELCQHCHVPGDVNKNEAHKDISQTLCTSCHDPHGGATTHLLILKEN